MSDEIIRVIETTRKAWNIPASAGFLLEVVCLETCT